MLILIECLASGYKVELRNTTQGKQIGVVRGMKINLIGDKPAKRTNNQVLVDCLPVIVSLMDCNASEVRYHRPTGIPRTTPIDEKQKPLF